MPNTIEAAATPLAQIYEISSTVLGENFDGEAVILELSKGQYFRLNRTGNLLWDLIRQNVETPKLLSTLVESYSISQEVALKDLTDFISTLTAEGIIIPKT